MQSLVYAPANCCLLLSRRVKLITKEIENNKYSSVSAIVSKNVWPYRFSHLRIIRLMNGFLLRKTINVLPIIHVDNVSSFEGKRSIFWNTNHQRLPLNTLILLIEIVIESIWSLSCRISKMYTKIRKIIFLHKVIKKKIELV